MREAAGVAEIFRHRLFRRHEWQFNSAALRCIRLRPGAGDFFEPPHLPLLLNVVTFAASAQMKTTMQFLEWGSRRCFGRDGRKMSLPLARKKFRHEICVGTRAEHFADRCVGSSSPVLDASATPFRRSPSRRKRPVRKENQGGRQKQPMVPGVETIGCTKVKSEQLQSRATGATGIRATTARLPAVASKRPTLARLRPSRAIRYSTARGSGPS
jgi:hypothetical protein